MADFPPRTSASLVGKIDLYLNQKHPTSSLTSGLPPQEYLNSTSAPSIRQVPRSQATIPSHGFQSFVTDQQQQWLTQPQSTPAPTPASSHAPPTPDSVTDFVLFPSPTQRSSNLVPATAHTDPNYLFGSSYNVQVQPKRLLSAQSQRVGNVLGSSPVSSNGLHSGLHASSASPTVQRQRISHARPPVPLFSQNSIGNLNQHPHTSAVPEPDSQDMVMEDFTRAGTLAGQSCTSFDDLMAGSFQSINDSFDATTSYDSSYTISPHDVLLDSAPPSSVYSNLTTPDAGYLESPQPHIKSSPYEQEILEGSESWPSLFPESEPYDYKDPGTAKPSSLQTSPASAYAAPEMSRTTSSGQISSRGSHQGRMSVSSGVGKHRRTQPLPPIKVDENDTIAVKRARNTLAARKSRQRRMERTEELEDAIARLTEEVEIWKARATKLGWREE